MIGNDYKADINGSKKEQVLRAYTSINQSVLKLKEK